MKSLQDWFRTPLGRLVVRAECDMLARRLAGIHSRRLLQVGAFGDGQRPALFGDTRQWLLDRWPGGPVDIAADPAELPFTSDSLDVVVLIHQLEFQDAPHPVLREAERVVAPEGHLLVVGFNPFSLWGLRRLLAGGRADPPWGGRAIGSRRVEDWLRLLGLDVLGTNGLVFPPPVNARLLLDRVDSLERWGRRYLRRGGGVYLTMAQKRVQAIPPVGLVWRRPKLSVLPGGMAAPTRRSRHHG